jgi:hypothetical protein
MARGPCTFRKRDLTTAIKAAVAAGCEVLRAEIEPATGKIVVVTGRPNAPNSEGTKATTNEWDEIDGTPSAAIR